MTWSLGQTAAADNGLEEWESEGRCGLAIASYGDTWFHSSHGLSRHIYNFVSHSITRPHKEGINTIWIYLTTSRKMTKASQSITSHKASQKHEANPITHLGAFQGLVVPKIKQESNYMILVFLECTGWSWKLWHRFWIVECVPCCFAITKHAHTSKTTDADKLPIFTYINKWSNIVIQICNAFVIFRSS